MTATVPQTLIGSRYSVTDRVRGSTTARHFGVWDHDREMWAALQNETWCWGMTADEALDALIELRGGLPMPRTAG